MGDPISVLYAASCSRPVAGHGSSWPASGVPQAQPLIIKGLQPGTVDRLEAAVRNGGG
jgi:hypothetical protein